jgi:hypothetical protein
MHNNVFRIFIIAHEHQQVICSFEGLLKTKLNYLSYNIGSWIRCFIYKTELS